MRVYTHLGLGDMRAVYETDSVARLSSAAARGRGGLQSLQGRIHPLHALLSPTKRSTVADMMGSLREAVGPDVDIMVDFHGRPASVEAAMAYLRAIEPARIMFAEEPVPPGDTAGLAHIAARSRCPSPPANA